MGFFTDLLKKIGNMQVPRALEESTKRLTEQAKNLPDFYKPDLKESVKKVGQAFESSSTPYGLAKDILVEAPARAVQSVVQSFTGTKEYTPKGNFEKLIFGSEPIKDIQTRTQETQQFIKEKAPVLSGASQPLAFLGVVGMTALDLTPFGGEKNVLKSIVKVSKFEDALKIAKDIGVAEDKINDFAKTAVAVKTEKEAKTLLESVKTASQEVAPTLQKTKQSIQELPKSEGIAKLGGELPQQIEKSVSSISNDITTLQKSKGVNVNNLNISQEGKNLINQEATDLAQQVIQKTGKVLKNDEVIKLAEQTSKQFKGAISREQTAQWEAAILRTRQKLAKAAESGVVDKDFIESYMSVKTIGTDIARKLQSLSISADPDKFNVGTILDAIIKQTGNADEIINAAKGVDFNDYKQAVEFYRKFIKPKAGEWIDLLRYNSMLSSPNTHLINAFSNLLNSSLIAPIEKTLTGGIDFLGSAITGKARKYFAGEGLKFAQGYLKNIKQATIDFAEVMKGKAPIGQLDIRRIPLATKGKAKVVENVLSYPLKLLEASDRFFMRLTESGEMAGVDFLGWVNFSDHRVLRAKTKNRMFKRIKDNPAVETISSYLGLLKHGNADKLRKNIEVLTRFHILIR